MAKQAKSTRDVVPSFAANVRALREARKMTQAELAERAGVHVSSLVRLEMQDRAPSLHFALKIAAALGKTVDALAKGWDAE